MPGETMPEGHLSDQQPSSSGPRSGAPELPVAEKQQPDPMLQMSTGRVGGGGFTLVAVAVLVILGFVFYGLNSSTPAEHMAAGPQAAHERMQPAAGGKSGAPTPGAPRTVRNGTG